MATSRLDKLRKRRMDPLQKVAGVNEIYDRMQSEDQAIQYALGAMQPIDPGYTARTIEQRDRVENQLKSGLGQNGLVVGFDYQGSITNDTHIRFYSDVDLLTVAGNFSFVEPPNTPTVPYSGNPIEEMKAIRKSAVTTLTSAFPKAVVDESGQKAVKISGGSLTREVDVIVCGWWQTTEYVAYQKKIWLGIEVLHLADGKLIPNKPFLHNHEISVRDSNCNGSVRKLIRLLKSLKYDSDEMIDFSSYDIAGVVHSMFDSLLKVPSGHDLKLLKNCQAYLQYLRSDANYRASIEIPNKMRKVFCAEGAKEAGLKQLGTALDQLVAEIETAMTRTLRKIDDTSIKY